MRPLKHYSAGSVDTAVSILGEYGDKARVVAGGTDLLGTLKDHIHFANPETLVNLKTIPGLSYITEDTEGLKIGALTKIREIERNQIIKEKYGLLAEAAHAVASPQLRNMGTIGGNICQEPRCWYYRNPDNTFNCTRKGGKFCHALTGENRYHSIFGAARVTDPPCVADCPGTVDIPSYLSRIREGDLSGAAAILLEANPIPAITGRVCPHFCEEECNRGEFDEAVSIRGIERYVGDYVLDHINETMRAPEADTGKQVAVIGSGPAGLSAAYYLRRLGHRVVVFEKMKEIGGMLAYGIPAYRLPKDVVRSQIKALENTGIEFRTGVDVGKDISMDALESEFDSIFLALGTWSRPSIGIEGEKSAQSGLEFLTNANLGVNEVADRKVVVIGGGNVALDAAITALRLGAKQVIVACLEDREEMPALEWEIRQALEEGIELMPSWGPSKIIASNKKVTGLELMRCTAVFDKEGHFSPRFDHAVKESIDADQILLATGLKPDLAFLDSVPSVRTGRGLIMVDHNTQATDMPGIFAGGDATRGPGTVIEAISAGRRAANAIAEYLEGKGAGNGDEDGGNIDSLLIFDTNGLKEINRTEIPQRPVSERTISDEDCLGLEETEMGKEANRCFNCGCVAVNPSDIAPALIALNARIKTTKRIVEAEKFFAARPLKSTILYPEELVTEIRIPNPRQDSNSTYSKFRIRQSIDFPIVSVASVFATASGKIEDARIVLGATAPVPLRVKETENFLKGKEITEDLAEEASAIAVKTAIPLCKNAYKIQITKALVKGAILNADVTD